MARQRRTPRSPPAARPPAARRPGGAPRPAGRPTAVRRTRTTSAEEEAEQDSRGPRFTGRAAVLFLVMLVLLISYASSLRAWLQQREDTQQARAAVVEAKQSIADLEREKERLHDPAYIKQQARERFGWLMPGETGYTTIDEDGDVLDGSGELSESTGGESGEDEEWFVKVWGSVETAGEEPSSDDGEDEEANTKSPNKKRVVRPQGLDR